MPSYTLKPTGVHLYIPPITWKGDPKGHIGKGDTFFFVVSGECFVMIDETCFILKTGQLAFLPKDKMRTYTAMSNDFTMYEFNFDFLIDSNYWYDELGLTYNNYHISVDDPDRIAHLFESSLRHEFDKDKMYDAIWFSNVAEIIKHFIKKQQEQQLKEKPFLNVLKFMEENISRHIKVEELSSAAYMQTTYFITKFKSAFGDTPITYLNKLKIYKAMTLLATTSLPIDKVSNAVGIYDNSYFSKLFKKYCFVTPLEYKTLLKKTD